MDSRICRIKAGILPASKIVLMSLIGLFSLPGCEKDDSQSKGRILLTTEKHQSPEKTSVRNITVQWITGDSIRFYDDASLPLDLSVTVNGDNAYVEGDGLSGDIRAYYPVSIIDATGASGAKTNTPTVVIPDRYDSYFDGGRQVLPLPLVGTAVSGAQTIEFKNLTAAVMVVIDNLTGSPLLLDSVKVTSGTYKLSGTLPLDLTAAGFGVAAQSGSGSVTVCFTDQPTLATSGYDTLQVPICPIGSGALQIQVYAHRQGDAISITGVPSVYKTVVYHYNDSKSVDALGRNVMMTARIALRTNSGDHTSTDTIDNSLFSVSGSKKVRFSKGNLWYNGSSYAFHNYQYDRVGTTQTESKDLFSWNDFSTAVSGWNILSADEWQYLVNTRPGNRFAKACVNSVNGLIIFPDTYHHPIAQALVKVNVSGSMSYSDNTFTSTQWGAMEGAGAIFLPAAGYLSGSTVGAYGAEGDYWSSTPDIEGKYKRLEFKSNEVTTANGAASSFGYSVRLVKSN